MIRLAKFDDDIMPLFEDAKLDFRNQGIDQWQKGYPSEADVINDIKKNKGYVYEQDGIIKAYFYLDFIADDTYEHIYEGNWLTNKPYGVIHRIVVSNAFKRCGIADEIINFAIQQASKQQYNMRIDTHQDNIAMQKLIEKHNFKYCGIIFTHDNSPRLAYEFDK